MRPLYDALFAPTDDGDDASGGDGDDFAGAPAPTIMEHVLTLRERAARQRLQTMLTQRLLEPA